ncbi:MAG: glycosyltransferase family 9 protein [Rhodospirillales bacterium]|nr:glycosyltransferase family 9 protein [Rhodospirillales bacterium]
MNEQLRSVLVYVGLDRVGDSLLKLPFVQGLRHAFQDAHITWLAGKDTSVYASFMAPTVDGLLDEVIDEAGIGLSLKELLNRPLDGRPFDLIIDTQRVALATLVVYRIRHKAFISPFGKFALSTRKPPKGYVFPKSMQRQMLDLLEIATGNTVPTPAVIDLPVDAALVAAATGALPAGPVYVGLSPGAGGLPKCWPLENFILLAKAQELADRVPVFILGPQEKAWQSEIKTAVPAAMFPLQTHDLGDRHGYLPQLTIALSRRLAVSVCNDSGTGHMCALGGQPLISLFGRTAPEKFTPMSPCLTIVRAQDYGGREMAFIPVDAVKEAVETVLA